MQKLIRNISRMKQILPKKYLNETSRKHVSVANFSTNKHKFLQKKADNVYLLDEDNSSGSETANHVNKYTQRTHTCGDVRMENVGETVTLCGWLEYQRMNKFGVLRDGYGETQILIPDKDIKTQKLLQSLPYESIVQVKGTVLSRPEKMRNKTQLTGDVEIHVEDMAVLNRAKEKLPFNIREFKKAKESLRMQYRYLDLRFPIMQRNLRVRSEMLMKMRQFLVDYCGFVDVETPTLFKATPGGAQEFIVPTRFPGLFYSLVQSPQQFKQMLMAGAIDRYFQIARCYRDEGARPDRQPEFTQLDIEMSFTSMEDILQLVEELLGYAWPRFLAPLPRKFPRMTFDHAMELYGSDQPDTRFECTLQNCTGVFNEKLSTCHDFGAYALVFPKEYANLSKTTKEKFNERSKQFPEVKFVQSKIQSFESYVGKISKLLTEPVAEKLSSQLNVPDDCLLFMAYGRRRQAVRLQKLLGKIRTDYADFLENLGLSVRAKSVQVLWVVDIPLFEAGETANGINSAHHPFTAPHPLDVHLLESDPLKARSLSFDLVLNGNEVGGGSVRIHDPKLQEKIFDILKIDKSSMQYIVDMLASGCPPHGGIALGLDRLLAKILKTSSIRDVIAFPKSFEGRCPLSGAPSPISQTDEKLYHVKSVYPVK